MSETIFEKVDETAMKTQAGLRKFAAPEILFGVGSRHHAGRYARNLGGRKILVVTDHGVQATGWTLEVVESLTASGLPFAVFTGVSPNPRSEEVMAGAEVFYSEQCNLLIAVGGGSTIDCAKGIGIVSSNRRPILEFEGIDRFDQPMPPLICIPTTAGAAADVSQFALINDPQEKRKVAIFSKALVPDVSLLDPEVLNTLDPFLTACTGMDALIHAVEAFVSTASSSVTDLHALEAIRLVGENLAPSVRDPMDLELRTRMMRGSLFAGLAFSNAILGVNHAMAHSLGGYLDLPHGQCNAALLDRVVEFNYPASPERFDRIAQVLGMELQGLTIGQRRSTLVDALRGLRSSAGLEPGLGAMGVKGTDIPVLSRQAMKDPCMVTNPRQPTRGDIEVLYGEAL